ncbi:nuclear transport factor 2 family protein [Nocardia sp. NPDC052278]|uniref:nuclear transport factor 2 family protein n=1 Tax=unclassified Nocardia TaxID=2637762 RepID=UPI0036774CB9
MSETEDRVAIADLIAAWIHRDNHDSDKLAATFHDDATISVSWFTGTVNDFLSANPLGTANSMLSKHFVGYPYMTVGKDRALAETNVMIPCDSVQVGFGCTVHARFFDRISRRDGVWRIEQRNAIYDVADITFPDGPVEIDRDALARYPREYAAFAYFMDKLGVTFTEILPTRGSEKEAAIKESGQQWLNGN